MTNRALSLCTALMALTVCSFVGCQPAAPDSGVDRTVQENERPSADQVLREMSAFLQSQDSFTARAEVTFDDVPIPGVMVQYSGVAEISVRRPNRLSLDYRDDISAKQFWYDGDSFTLFDPTHNVYASTAAKPTLDATIDHLMERYAMALPLADFTYSDPYAVLMEGVQFKRHVGLHEVDGILCHHLIIYHENINWQIWVDAGQQPLPRKVVITYKMELMAPQFVAVFSDWDFSTPLPDSSFVPVIPEDALEIEFAAIQEIQQ